MQIFTPAHVPPIFFLAVHRSCIFLHQFLRLFLCQHLFATYVPPIYGKKRKYTVKGRSIVSCLSGAEQISF